MKEYGEFIKGKKGAFRINDVYAQVSSEFIYQNGDILLKVDENGVISAQANPPQDIMLFKREYLQKSSNLQIYISLNGIDYFSCFGYPNDLGGKKTVEFYPEKAVYITEFDNLKIVTTLFIPLHGADIIFDCRVINKSNQPINATVLTCILPYVNEALLAPWDKSEWYLETCLKKADDRLVYVSKHYTPTGNYNERRLITCQMSQENSENVEISYENLVGKYDFFSPSKFNYSFNAGNIGNSVMRGYPSVYSTKYKICIEPKAERNFTNVISMQNIEKCGEYDQAETEYASRFLQSKNRDIELSALEKFYNELFKKFNISTGDEKFDNYIESFLPLQMYWVSNLDRGWPTGMRGVRDASNDCIGELYFDTLKCKNILELLASCERSDGWLPRQISTLGKNGKHDLRPYCDGGAFYLEFVYYFLNFTGETDTLLQDYEWLDNNNKSSLLDHILTIFEYYTSSNNLGEHNLIKIFGGDWLDAVNNAGQKGIGESVTVTCQVALALNYYREIFDILNIKNERFEKCYAKKAILTDAVTSAFNKEGFFNSVYSDNGYWIFSDKDSDNAKRVYIPANSFAIFSGIANESQTKQTLDNISSLKSESGYKLFSPSFKSKIDGVGRLASGDMGDGLLENGAVYNHGSHGFLSRAFAYSNRAPQLNEVIDFLLPYTHNIKNSKTAPYAIVNCYQGLSMNLGRGGMPFLTGTTAYLMRAVYDFKLGIRPKINGIAFNPCLLSGNINIKVKFTIRDKILNIKYLGVNTNNKISSLVLNGKIITTEFFDITTNKLSPIIPFNLLKENNEITINF